MNLEMALLALLCLFTRIFAIDGSFPIVWPLILVLSN